MLEKLKDLDKVRLVVLDHLLAHKNKINITNNKHVRSKKNLVSDLF
jgi:hypothetical protein